MLLVSGSRPPTRTMSLLRKTLANLSSKIPSFLPTASTSKTHHQSLHSTNPNATTSATYDELISTAGRSRDLTTLHRLLNKRYKEGLFNTANTFKFLTDVDFDLKTHLLQTLSKLEKGFCRKNAFDCLIAHLCKFNHIEESNHVIEFMIENTIGVNAVTFHPLINALTRKKRFDEAWGVLERMKGTGVVVDITSYNFLVSSYCFNGDLPGAARVMERITEQGLREDSRTYDALVMGACRVGKVDGALVLLRRMEEDSIQVLYSTHGHVIRSLVGLGCFAQAVEFVMAYAGRDVALDTVNFVFLLTWLIKRKRVEEAKFVFGEMEKRGLVMGDKLKGDCKNLLLSLDSKEI